MSTPASKTLSDALRALSSARLISIAFIEDYVQIEISAGRMTILEPLRLEEPERSLYPGDAEFADEVRSCTGAVIENVQATDEYILLRLSNGKALRIALSEATAARETFIYQDAMGRTWVAGPA